MPLSDHYAAVSALLLAAFACSSSARFAAAQSPFLSAEIELAVVDHLTKLPVADAEILGRVLREDDREAWAAFDDLGRIDALVEHPDWSFRTGDQGRLAIPRPDQSVVVIVRAGERFGRYQLHRGSPATVQIETVIDRPVHVRVVDEAGSPVAGVGVALRQHSPIWTTNLIARRTSVDGRATLPHAGFAVDREPRQGTAPYERYAVGIDECLAQRVERPLAERAIPADVITLVMPGTGRVEVIVLDIDGTPARIEEPIGVHVHHGRESAPYEPSWFRRWFVPGSDHKADEAAAPVVLGRAVFEHVGCGVELEIVGRRNAASAPFRASVTTPSAAFDRIEVPIRLTRSRAVLRGRLVDAERRPIASEPILVDLFGTERYDVPESAVVRTDSDGAFVLEYAIAEFDHETPSLGFTRHAGESGATAVTIDVARWWRRGVHDLGSLTMRDAPLLVAGFVVDGDGAPVGDAQVSISEFKASPRFVTKTDVAGAFELRGVDVRESLEVVVRKDGYAWSETRSLARASDMRITIQRAGTIFGKVVLPTGIASRSVIVCCTPTSAEARRWMQTATATIRDDGKFCFSGLLPGTYDVSAAARRSAIGIRQSVVIRGDDVVELEFPSGGGR